MRQEAFHGVCMIPAGLFEQFKQGLSDFLRYSFWSSTPGMERVIDDLLAEPGGVTKGPFVSVQLPFETVGSADFFPDVPLPYLPYRHQVQAFERLGRRRKRSTLIATGTGSGKTECFLLPILDYCLENRGRHGVKAVIVYPMNALAQDQAERMARLIHTNERLRGRIRVGLYVGYGDRGGAGGLGKVGKGRGAGGRGQDPGRVGQASMTATGVVTDRQAMQDRPPDILLTNYKMLDYLLLRQDDQDLWRYNDRGVLRFLVVDELHQFDGAKATDLACLIRRLKRRLQADDGSLCCVGTSATMGGPEAHQELREFAGRLFGETFDEDSVIREHRQDVAAFLAGVAMEHTQEPGPEDLETLAAANWPDPEQWLRNQERLWFDPSDTDGDGKPLDDRDWALRLGGRLMRHATFRSLLELLERGPVSIDEVVSSMAQGRASWRDDPELGRLAVLSLIGLASAARREVPLASQGRAGGGGADSVVVPFLVVRLQLWQRELRRMVASVATPGPIDSGSDSDSDRDRRPRLTFSDDLDRTQRRRHLPLVHCRECGAMGWVTQVSHARRQVYRTDLYALYRAFFRRDPLVRFLFPSAAKPHGDPLWDAWKTVRLDTTNLERVPEDQDPPTGHEVAEVVVVEQTEKRSDSGQVRHLVRDCPFCGARDSLALVGFRAATLTSLYVDQYFASRYAGQEDRKLLVFSDSVQDAAHRAGFLAARTWRTNLRIALAQFIRQADGPLRLSEVAQGFSQYWHERMDDATWVATFLAPNMAWMRDWEQLRSKGALPRGSRLMDDVRHRIEYEISLEFSHQSAIGRSLPRTGVAGAFFDTAAIAEAAAGLVDPLRNEVPGLGSVSSGEIAGFLLGLLHHMRRRGAVWNPQIPPKYTETLGEDIHSFKRRRYLPV